MAKQRPWQLTNSNYLYYYSSVCTQS